MSQKTLLIKCKDTLDEIADIVAPGETIIDLKVIVDRVQRLADRQQRQNTADQLNRDLEHL